MTHLNKIILQGNLTRDPEYKNVGDSGLCTFAVATNRKYKDQEEVCFTDIVVWGKLAEICSKYLHKGSKALVEGRLKLDTWEQEGKKRSKHVVVANEVVFLDSKENN
jgi:single-strand DNA-binding protein